VKERIAMRICLPGLPLALFGVLLAATPMAQAPAAADAPTF
jgi:hypothetical protein